LTGSSRSSCEPWNINDTELLTPFLGAEIDSLQLCFEMLDTNAPGDFHRGFHRPSPT
jgi:hypothetical protein